jgi:enoyl-CoA hydratase/carnithine racemase
VESGVVIYEKEDGVGIITLNKPKSMNTINMIFINELNQHFEDIERDEEVGVVIIKGREKVFCAGADIEMVRGLKNPLDAHRFLTLGRAQALMNNIENLEKPVIAAIDGPALGGGLELILACDIRIATENSIFGSPEIKIGVIPGGGGIKRLTRLIGLGKAKEILLMGEPINAQEAYRFGLLNKVVEFESLMDEAKNMARKLMKQPRYALMMTKDAINKGMDMNLQSALTYESRCFEILFSTEDQKEGMEAFLKKRKPLFKGYDKRTDIQNCSDYA